MVTTKAWLAEPDSKEWVDDASGYLCLALRGPHGAWCGYVGVPAAHPAAGLDYYISSFDIEDLLGERKTLLHAKVQHAVNQIEIHGGLTFAGSERPHSRHVEGTWWFGFDCSHAGDYSPKYERENDPVLGLGKPTGWGGVIEYRDLPYVEAELTSLASQLQKIEAPNG